jgi:hypothetical protein
VRLHFFPYRYADAVLDHATFKDAQQEILAVLSEVQAPLLNPNELDGRRGGVKRRKRKGARGDPGDRYFFLPVDQKALNRELDRRFKELDWTLQPRIVEVGSETGPRTGLKGDYKKGPLQVEVQFGNMARWYTDVFKFQLSYSLNRIDVAVLVVPMQRFANLIDENVACYERVERELPHAKMSLTLPILVIGVEPEDYRVVRECYELAAHQFPAEDKTNARAIPYDQRIAEEPLLEDEETQETTDA